MEVIKLHSSNTCRFRKHRSFLRFFSFASSALQSSTFRYSFCTCTSKSISFQAESGAMVEVVRQERVAFLFNQRIVEFSVLHDCFEPKLVLVQLYKRKSESNHNGVETFFLMVSRPCCGITQGDIEGASRPEPFFLFF